MARRIRWQILIASVSAALVLGLIAYLALTTAVVASPVAGGEFTEYEIGQPGQLNPLVSDPARDPAAADLQALLFDGLVRIGNDGLPEPALLAELPVVDDTGTVYSFTLRPGVTWHDGEPVTVDDVLFTLRAVQSAGFAGDSRVADAWRNVLFEQTGDQSFQATLATPYAPLLSFATFPILPAHLLADVPPEEWGSISFNQSPVGTGPYRLAQAVDANRALLVANTEYYRGRPYLDSIELRFGQNAQDALTALSRNLAIGFGISSTNQQSRVNTPRGSTRYTAPLDAYTTLTFNMREQPFSDQGLRRALALAIDKQAVIQAALDGQGQSLATPILPGWWVADPAAEQPTFDAAAAAAALDSLGYQLGADGTRSRDGTPLHLSILTDSGIADHAVAARAVANLWAQLGVPTDVEVVEADQLDARLQAHDFTIALHGWQRQGSDPDAVYALWHSSGTESGFNYAGLADPQIDDQLTIGRESTDFETRLNAYQEFQRRWASLVPGVALYQPLYVYTALSDLGGLEFDPNQSAFAVRPLLIGREDRFRNILGWYLQSNREIRGDLSALP